MRVEEADEKLFVLKEYKQDAGHIERETNQAHWQNSDQA
jgi:hypothetical protein